MSGLLGGGKTASTSVTRYQGIQVQSSVAGSPIPMGWGTFKCSCNLLWYGGFKSQAIKQKTGGKGGGSQVTGYNYWASIMLGICAGPIAGIRTVYKDETALSGVAAAGLTLFAGALGQGPWSYLSSNFADQAIGYGGIAYVAASNYALSTSATLPNHSFEVQSATRVAGKDDANPKDIISQFLPAVPYWQASWQADYSAYGNYCLAQGLLLSPVIDSQRAASDFLTEILQATNSDCLWSEGLLKIAPYADSPVTGNGVTYTPNLTPIYALDDTCFIPKGDGEDPVLLAISKDDDAWNYVQVEYLDRSQQYNTQVVPGTDPASIDQWGKRVNDSPYSLHSICDAGVAATAAQLIVQRTSNLRRTFQLSLPWNYCLLDPMDLVSITSGDLQDVLVRITEISENEEGQLDFTAEEMLVGTASPPSITRQTPCGYVGNYQADPGSVANPVMVNPPLALTGGDYELWIGVSGMTPNWGGCEIWASWDKATYEPVGVIDAPARYGTTTSTLAVGSDPDRVNSFGVDLTISGGTLNGATSIQADNHASLALVGSEVIAYSVATLTSANQYALGTYIRRGLDGTTIASQPSGSTFLRLDSAVFGFGYKKEQVGKTVYIKFRSFNVFRQAYQDISTVTAYSVALTPSTAAFTAVDWTAIGDSDPNRPRPTDGATVNPPGQSLQPNDSFETYYAGSGFPGWTLVSGTATQVTSATPGRGLKSAQMTGYTILRSTTAIPVTPGEMLYFGAGLATTTNDTAGATQGSGHWSLYYVDQSGVGRSMAIHQQAYTLAQGYQSLFNFPVVVPAGVTSITLLAVFEEGDASSNAIGQLDYFTVSRAQDGSTAGATVGTNILSSSGTLLPVTDLQNSQIGYDATGALTNIGTPGVIVRNDKLAIQGDALGVGGKVRALLYSNGGAVSTAQLPDGVQNQAITVSGGTIGGIGTGGGTYVDNSKVAVGPNGYLMVDGANELTGFGKIANAQISLNQSGTSYSLSGGGSGATISAPGLGVAPGAGTNFHAIVVSTPLTVIGNSVTSGDTTSHAAYDMDARIGVAGISATVPSQTLNNTVNLVWIGLATSSQLTTETNTGGFQFALQIGGTLVRIIGSGAFTLSASHVTGSRYQIVYDGNAGTLNIWQTTPAGVVTNILSQSGVTKGLTLYPKVMCRGSGNTLTDISTSGSPATAALGTNVVDSSGNALGDADLKNIAIGITSGAITGIGAGNSTVVDNSVVNLSSTGTLSNGVNSSSITALDYANVAGATKAQANATRSGNLLSLATWQDGRDLATPSDRDPTNTYYRLFARTTSVGAQVISINAIAGPSGGLEPVLVATGKGNYGDGGATHDFGVSEGYDPTKSYRFSIWINWTVNSIVYVGLNSCLTLSGTVNGNAYWYGGGGLSTFGGTAGKWYLFVGILHGSGYTGTTNSGITGVYDPVTGNQLWSGADYKSNGTTTPQSLRYFFYSSVNGTQFGYFARPSVEEISSLSVASVPQMLATPGAISGTNLQLSSGAVVGDSRIDNTLNTMTAGGSFNNGTSSYNLTLAGVQSTFGTKIDNSQMVVTGTGGWNNGAGGSGQISALDYANVAGSTKPENYATASDNLIFNGSLSSAAGWTLPTGCSWVAGGTTDPFPGYLHFTQNGIAYNVIGASIPVGSLPVVAGENLYFSCLGRGDEAISSNCLVPLNIRWYASNKTTIIQTSAYAFQFAATNTVQTIAQTLTAPSGAAYATINIGATIGTGATYIDVAMVRLARSQPGADVTSSNAKVLGIDSGATRADNLIKNADFRDGGTVQWSTNNASGTAAFTAASATSPAYWQSGSSSGNDNFYSNAGANGQMGAAFNAADWPVIEVGKTVQLSVSIATDGSRRFQLVCRAWTTAGVASSLTNVIDQTINTAGVFTLYKGIYTMPAGANYLQVFLSCISSGSGTYTRFNNLRAAVTELGATQGATVGTNVYAPGTATALPATDLQNSQIGYDGNGALTNIATSGVVIRNDKLAVQADTGGTGGKVRALLSSNGTTVSTLQLPDGVQNQAITVTSGVLTGVGTTGINVDNSGIAITGGKLVRWSGDTGLSTIINNSQITVSGGVLTGIGTAGVTVDNNVLQGALTGGSVVPAKSAAINGQGPWATANVTYTTAAPSSPATGDIWVNTTGTPNVWQRWSGSAWVAATPTATSQLSDDAGLGSSAAWTNVTGRPTSLSGLDSSAATKLGGIAANATVGAVLGTNMYDTNGTTALGAADLKNSSIAITAGVMTGIGTAGVTVDNSKIGVTYDTGGTGGRVRAQVTSNGSGIGSATTLPDTVQNQAITVTSGVLTGVGTAGVNVDNSAISITGGKLVRWSGDTGLSTIIDNSQIGISAGTGQITGIGAGNNIAVANNQITVSSGVLSGIGTAGVTVDNNVLQGALTGGSVIPQRSSTITSQGALATLNAVDPSTSQVKATGSIPPTVPDNSFAYSATTTSVTISWPAITIYRADGTTIGISSGSQTVTTLSANTSYKVYPYVADSGGTTGSVAFVSGGAGVGSPAMMYNGSTGNAAAAAAMAARGNIPLNGFNVITPASGSSGGGGGGSQCFHERAEVETPDGFVSWRHLSVGSLIASPDGWSRIVELRRKRTILWSAVAVDGGREDIVHPSHVFYRANGDTVHASDLKLGDLLRGKGDHREVTGLRLVREEADRILAELDDPHLYFGGRAALLSHNAKP